MLIATSLGACVSNPAQGVAPRRARVQIDDKATTVTNFVPGAGYYRERVAWKNWRYLDGKHDVDEQDWWMLTDPSVSTQIKHARDRAERLDRVTLDDIVQRSGPKLTSHFIVDSALTRLVTRPRARAATSRPPRATTGR